MDDTLDQTPAIPTPETPDTPAPDHAPDAVTVAVLDAIVGDGMTYRQAAAHVGCTRWRIEQVMAEYRDPGIEAATRSYMRSKAAAMVDTWVAAATEGAAKGRHEPARDYLTHARIIEPVSDGTSTGTGRVAVFIGIQQAK